MQLYALVEVLANVRLIPDIERFTGQQDSTGGLNRFSDGGHSIPRLHEEGNFLKVSPRTNRAIMKVPLQKGGSQTELSVPPWTDCKCMQVVAILKRRRSIIVILSQTSNWTLELERESLLIVPLTSDDVELLRSWTFVDPRSRRKKI